MDDAGTGPKKINPHYQELPGIAKGAGVLFTGGLIGKALIFLFTILIARALTPSDLGLYYLGSAIAFLLVVFAALGLEMGVLRFVSMFHGEKDSARAVGTIYSSLFIALPASIVISILLFLNAGEIAASIFDKPGLERTLSLFSLVIPFLVVGKIFIAVSLGSRLMRDKVANELGEILLRFFFTFLFVYLLGWGLEGAVLGVVLSGTMAAFLALYLAQKAIPILNNRKKPIYALKKLLLFSYPQLFSEFFVSMTSYTDTLMLGYFRSAAEVGIYSIAAKLGLSAFMISASFRLVFAPIIADLHHQGDLERLSALFKVVTRWIFTLSLPVFLVLILFPEAILKIFGKDFTAGSTCLIILSLGYLLCSGAGPVNHMILMTGRSGLNSVNHLIGLILNLALNYLLIPKYGILGAAIAVFVSLVSLDIMRLIETFYLMKIHPYNRSHLKSLLAGAFSFMLIQLIFRLFAQIPEVVGIVLFLFCYSVTIYLFKFDEEELFLWNEFRRKAQLMMRRAVRRPDGNLTPN
jgi:O-antigen/teichoic acid export membrane protein